MGQMAGNQVGILAAVLLPAPASNAAPAPAAFLNLINLFVSAPEITVPQTPAVDPMAETVDISSAATAEAQTPTQSNASLTTVGQMLWKGARPVVTVRAALPKQIAGALMRAMLGNSTPNLTPTPTPAIPPQAVAPGVIASSPTPVPVAPPLTVANSPQPAQTIQVATGDPSNPHVPTGSAPGQTQATTPNLGASATTGNVAPAPAPVNPEPPVFQSGLAFGLNLTPVNAPLPLHAPDPKTDTEAEQPNMPADSKLLVKMPAAIIPPDATPDPAPQVLASAQSPQPASASPLTDRRPATPKLEIAQVKSSQPPSKVLQSNPVRSTQARSNQEPSSETPPEPQPETMPESGVKPEPARAVQNVAPQNVTAQAPTELAATPQEPEPGVSDPKAEILQSSSPSNGGITKTKPAAPDVIPNHSVASPAQTSDISDKDTQAGAIDPLVKAAPEQANNLGRTVEMRTPTDPSSAQDASSPTETPYHAAAEAIRSAEPIQPVAPVKVTGAVQEFTVRIAQPDTPAVDVHILERAGQVQVAVRTPDASMQSSLREDLGTLVNSLQRAGYRADTFTPQTSAVLRAASSETSSQEDRDRQDSHPGNSGGGAGNPSDRQQQQRQRDQRSKAWFEELEKQV
jgi:hypothetical protein